MANIFAALLTIATFMFWGFWLCDRTWEYVNDLDSGFFISIVPVAILLWLALYIGSSGKF